MLVPHVDLASASVHAHQERLLAEARATRQGPGPVRIAIGQYLVRLGKAIGGTPVPFAGGTPPIAPALR
jgi:hypothetical protein